LPIKFSGEPAFLRGLATVPHCPIPISPLPLIGNDSPEGFSPTRPSGRRVLDALQSRNSQSPSRWDSRLGLYETDFLRRYELFRARIEAMVDMPDRIIDLLFRFLQQNGGRLSNRARQHEFMQMTDAEVTSAEDAYATAFSRAAI